MIFLDFAFLAALHASNQRKYQFLHKILVKFLFYYRLTNAFGNLLTDPLMPILLNGWIL